MRPGRCTLVCLALVTGCAPGAAPQATTQDPDSTHAAAAAEHAMSGMSMPTVVEDLHMKLTPERRAAPRHAALARLDRRPARVRAAEPDRHRGGVHGRGRPLPAAHFRLDGARQRLRVRRPAHHLGRAPPRGHGGDAPLTRAPVLRLGALVAGRFFPLSGGAVGLEGLGGAVGPGGGLALLFSTPPLYRPAPASFI